MLERILDHGEIKRNDLLEIYKNSKYESLTVASLIKEFAERPLTQWSDGPQLTLCEAYVSINHALDALKDLIEDADTMITLSPNQKRLFEVVISNIQTSKMELKMIHRIVIDRLNLN